MSKPVGAAIDVGRPTSRDLLVKIAGKTHAEHTVTGKKIVRMLITIKCSCGAKFETAATKESLDSLRNVEPLK